MWRALKKGSSELVVLALLEDHPRYGYEIGKTIQRRSQGILRFHVASLYPILYRMEKRGWIRGTWERTSNARRRRFYRLTPKGKKVLADQRRDWQSFAGALHRVAGVPRA